MDIDRTHGLRAGIERALREAVRSGQLSPGSRLPSSRVLAQQLGVARNTVSQVYEQLAAEGYLTARPRSGMSVAPRPGQGPPPDLPLASPFRAPVTGFDLRPGLPDLSLFPRRAWLAATRHVLRTMPHAALAYGDPHGSAELREALAGYLGRARGVITTPGNVLICAGYTHALRMLCQAVDRGRSTIAFEDPTVPDYPALAGRSGLHVRRIPVDGAGLMIGHLGDEVAAVVTPAHQFPTGVTLSPQRRRELVGWARRAGAVVVEDDYDGEFRYDRQPIGALQGLDPDTVVYIGTVSKTIAPALRIAWLVAPTRLIPALREVLRFQETYVNVIDQLILAQLIRSGELDRHLRRCRTRYRQRRDRLGRAVAEQLPPARLSGVAAGLHAVLHLPGTIADEPELLDTLTAHGVAVDRLSGFHHRPADAALGVVVGYTTPPQHAFEGAVSALVTAVRAYLRPEARGSGSRG
ncbi:GntR family transcriptional regulator [Actinoplanes cyaneus]|uniref:GntR family transcriptional regulator n=1 Tax=Actinoplanes cyaneus TaxID=52696 RepID=A0A919M2F6_9ACTN|nr:PLP-dependent aminotransferase family protein [Actinoplanes cyaneus]GID67205.1 GntR family transcriptional regulator [Actinoplanes cyaneus]